MSEETKNVEEVVEEINPIDEYLNNYKEQKLAEFCVRKDKEIESRKNERQKLMDQITEMKQKIEEYNKCFVSTDALYKKIKSLPVDEYLDLYNKFVNDVSRSSNPYTIATTVNGLISTTGSPW